MKVLFVCMGNICRSPTAEGVMRHRVRREGLEAVITVDSAGTHDYHPGSPPDPRSQHHARLRGYDLGDLRARQIVSADFERFDLILAMDQDNQSAVESLSPSRYRHKVRRFAEFFVVSQSAIVPDPYFGPPQGFEEVLDLVEDGVEGLIRHFRQSASSRCQPQTG